METFLFKFFMMAFLMSVLSVSGIAQDSETLLKQLNSELRQAEKDMFGGQNDKAVASLENIQKLIADIRAMDANNPKLKTAENKYNKLVKDLERRTGKDLGGGSVTATKSGTALDLPAKPAAPSMTKAEKSTASATQAVQSTGSAANVPYEARKPLSTVNQQLNSLQTNLDNLADPAYRGNKDQLVGNMEKKIDEIESKLDEAKNLAAKKGVSSHPEFDEAEKRLTDAKNKVAAAKTGHEEKKAVAAAKAGEINSDVADLKTTYDRVRPVFDKATGYVSHYNDLETLEALITDIESFEKNEQGKIEGQMKSFASKYGSSKEEIDKNADQMGYNGQYRASFPYTELATGIENVGKTRTVMAEDIVRRAKDQLENISEGRGHDFSTGDRYADAKAWINMAARFDADNPKVKEAMGTIDSEMSAGMKKMDAQIDSRTWPGHASNAPSNAKELARTALEWFKNDPGWGKNPKEPRQPLAIAVTGPWSVQKKNLLGEPIMYGLPVLLAVQLDSEKKQNVARVYSLTMRTMEQRGAKMEPPFDHVTVGNSYYIRPGTVK